jgi:ABC-type transport system involved in multi-copper enzyme maturation permease subunit
MFSVGMPTFGGFRDITLGVMLFTALFALSGLAFAAITRNQTAAIALILLLPSVVEEVAKGVVVIIRAVSDEPLDKGGMAALLKFLPYDAGSQMFTQFSIDDFLEPFGVVSFGPLGGGLVMATFVAILLAASAALFLRRDA